MSFHANHAGDQITNYYPFSLTIDQPHPVQVDAENPYHYNGIEKFKLPLLDINHTLYRTLDPAVDRWLQVDPKAETMYDHAPHNSMGIIQWDLAILIAI